MIWLEHSSTPAVHPEAPYRSDRKLGVYFFDMRAMAPMTVRASLGVSDAGSHGRHNVEDDPDILCTHGGERCGGENVAGDFMARFSAERLDFSGGAWDGMWPIARCRLDVFT